MITKDNNYKVMEYFFKYPNRTFHIRELARLTGLSSTGVIKIVKKLKKGHLLVSKKARMVEEVKPDFDGRFVIMKRLYNLFSILDCGLLEYLKTFFELPKAIILFGSYSSGLDTEKSDIDVAIVDGKKDMPDLSKFETKLARKINLHIINIEKASAEFKNSIANGIVLHGFAEVVK